MQGSRIRVARELCGLTQTELAVKIGTTQPGIASLESGRYSPSIEFLQKIAIATAFDISFFEKGDLPEFSAGTLLYRTQASVKQGLKTQAHAHALVAFDFAESLAKRLKNIPANIPTLKEDPVRCAQFARAALGISPNTPIKSLLRTLEKNGVYVLVIPMEVDGLDGFSCWAGEKASRPIIGLLQGKVGYRNVFTLAEEFGHLSMHRPLTVSVQEADEEARAFAQEFLLPAEAMELEMQRPVTLSGLADMKQRWGVAIQFLIKRASTLNFVTDNQYRYLMQQCGPFRKKEPGDDLIVPEKPKMLRTMAEILYGNPINIPKLSRDSGLTGKQLRDILGLDEQRSPQVLQFKSRSVSPQSPGASELPPAKVN